MFIIPVKEFFFFFLRKDAFKESEKHVYVVVGFWKAK